MQHFPVPKALNCMGKDVIKLWICMLAGLKPRNTVKFLEANLLLSVVTMSRPLSPELCLNCMVPSAMKFIGSMVRTCWLRENSDGSGIMGPLFHFRLLSGRLGSQTSQRNDVLKSVMTGVPNGIMLTVIILEALCVRQELSVQRGK